MKIAIASDYAATPLKEEVRTYAGGQDRGIHDLNAYNKMTVIALNA